jgi:hypothetical protein
MVVIICVVEESVKGNNTIHGFDGHVSQIFEVCVVMIVLHVVIGVSEHDGKFRI